MGLNLNQSLKLRQVLAISGGLSTTIFPEVDELLRETDYWEGLQFVASKKRMDRYHSIMDFLVCEIFTQFRRAAFLYYEDKGPLLKEIINDEDRERMARWLVAAMHLARKQWMDKLEISWCAYRAEVLKIAA